MKILILGGTIFLGRHLVDAASERGHEVTLFHRGIHGADLYPHLDHLRGDRRDDLHALMNRQWDVVIDTNGYLPSFVQKSARLLSDTVKQYIFISSISVYADQSLPGLDESAPTSTITPEQLHEMEKIVAPTNATVARAYGEFYGALKALCERAAIEAMPDRVLVVRPGLIVGPYDYSDRFSYWVNRVAQGGEVLAPGYPEFAMQLIDARDLAQWIIRMTEDGHNGVYNATGLAHTLTMRQVLQECKTASKSNATFSWVDETFLLQEHVQPWSQLPLWLPDEPESVGFNAISSAKAIAAGLTFRSLEETVRDTLAWERTRPNDRQSEAGLTLEEEARLLQLWHHHS